MSSSSLPKLVISKSLGVVEVDLHGLAEAMRSLGVPEKTIQETVVYIDGRPHLRIMGSVWPKSLAKLRYPQLKPIGCVMRLSSRMLFHGSTSATINRTLIHEIEHLAQIERKDIRLIIGYLTNLVLLAAGLGLGLTNESSNDLFKVLMICITGLFGLELGYMLSAHEIQARQTSAGYKHTQTIIKMN